MLVSALTLPMMNRHYQNACLNMRLVHGSHICVWKGSISPVALMNTYKEIQRSALYVMQAVLADRCWLVICAPM